MGIEIDASTLTPHVIAIYRVVKGSEDDAVKQKGSGGNLFFDVSFGSCHKASEANKLIHLAQFTVD